MSYLSYVIIFHDMLRIQLRLREQTRSVDMRQGLVNRDPSNSDYPVRLFPHYFG